MITGSISYYTTSSVDENGTAYDLFPLVINREPVIIKTLHQASNPPIRWSADADGSGNFMYRHEDGIVKIHIGADIEFRVEAEQPPILNVENGIPKMINPSAGLNYTWKKDNQVQIPETDNSLHSSIIIKGPSLQFKNIQPKHEGDYFCEISNDVGIVSTETVSIRVYRLDDDSNFYQNLITNPYGYDGLDGWESNNSDFTTADFTKATTKELTNPKLDKFGYVEDCFHPRPYQIDAGILQKYDIGKKLNYFRGKYFTRSRYKFEKKDGSFLVRAYQDIDVSSLQEAIRGSIYGLEGVRAFFSCYIGNAVTEYLPVDGQLTPDTFSPALGEPRLSAANFLKSGPSLGSTEKVYVSIEEYDNETRLPSTLLIGNKKERHTDRVTLYDPWSKRVSKYSGQQYYAEDIYQIGSLSQNDSRDTTLFIADELYPNKYERFTYGQYAEFNKVVLDKLNPKTNKIRITINFETTDVRIFDAWKDGIDASEDGTIYKFVSYETPFEENSWIKPPVDWNKAYYNQYKSLAEDLPLSAVAPSAQPPHGMVTGLNLSLIPILKHKKEVTDHYTTISLNKNNTPTGDFVSGIIRNRPYDPFGVRTGRLVPNFNLAAGPTPIIGSNGSISNQVHLVLSIDEYRPNTDKQQYNLTQENLFPFNPNTEITYRNTSIFVPTDEYTDMTYLMNYLYEGDYASLSTQGLAVSDYNPNSNPDVNPYSLVDNPQNTMAAIAINMRKEGWITPATTQDIDGKVVLDYTEYNGEEDQQGVWKNKVRYVIYLNADGGSSIPFTELPKTPYQVEPTDWGFAVDAIQESDPSPAFKMQTYYLDIDFSNTQGRVTLSRSEDLAYGQGSGSYELPYTIVNNSLVMRFPDELLIGTGSASLGYPTQTDNFTIKATNAFYCIHALRTTMETVSVGPINTNYQYLSAKNAIIDQLTARKSSLSTASAILMDEYINKLQTYSQTGVLFNTNLYNALPLDCDLLIDYSVYDDQLVFTGVPDSLQKLRKIGGINTPKIIAVRPTPIGADNGSPSGGVDAYDFVYKVDDGIVSDIPPIHTL